MIVLASASPRRKQLMKECTTSSFLIDIGDIDESKYIKDDVISTVKAIAKAKGEDIFKRHPNDTVISADTIVVIDNKILGKPVDEDDALKMLKSLRGRTHQVMTGFYIKNKEYEYNDVDISSVTLKSVDEQILLEYIKRNPPLDKAGSYGIQDLYFKDNVLDKYEGSLNNIIGFPTEKISNILNKILAN